MKRTLHKLVKWCYLIAALMLILLALLVQSGRSLSPVLADYNQAIGRYLSEQLAAQVTIGAIQAEWNGLKPSLVVDQLQVQDNQGQPIVSLEEARMRFDILKSLTNRRVVWSNLSLDRVDMEFVQTAEGFWRLSGAISQQDPDLDTSARLDALVDMLLLSTRIELQHSRLRFTFSNGQQTRLESPYVLLENAGDFHRLSLQIDVDEQPRSAYLIIEGQGDPRQPDSFRSKGHLQLNRFPTGEPIAAASAFLLSGTDRPALQTEGSLNANLWFESRPESQGYDLVGSLALQRVSVPLAERRLVLDDFTAELNGYWLPGGDWQLGLQALRAVVGEQQIDRANIAFSSKGYRQPLDIKMDRLDLARLNQLFIQSGALGTGPVADVLAELDARGELRNIAFTLPLHQPSDWKLRANLDQVAVSAWRGVPALTGLDGYLEAGQRAGFVNIDSRSGFSMHYSPTFDQAMDYDRARGQVAWHLQREKNQIYVNSGLLEFAKGQELAQGYMWLSLPWQRNTGDIDLYLQVAGRNVNAQRYSIYTPQTLPDSLRDWLAQSLGEQNPGLADRVAFIYRGTLNTKNSQARTAQLALDVRDVTLNYHPGWPALSALAGSLSVSDASLSAQVRSAQVLTSRIEQAQVELQPRAEGQGSLLQVKGQVQGQASDGIRVLREGQLRQYLGTSMDSWVMQGEMQADLDLAIALGAPDAGAEESYQRVVVGLNAPLFELQNLDLRVQELQGEIRYDSRTGIASDKLTGVLFDEPLSLSLSSDKRKGRNKTLIDFQGRVDSQALAAWSKRPEGLFLRGPMSYQAQVQLNHQILSAAEGQTQSDAQAFAANAFARFNLTSDLQGVSIDLPAPYGKRAKSKRPFEFNLWLQEQQAQIRVDYNRDVQALLRIDRSADNQLLNANIALAADAELTDQARFLVSGFLPSIDIEAWKAVQQRYLNYAERLTPARARGLQADQPDPAPVNSGPGMLAGLPFSIELMLGQYELGPMQLENLAVKAAPVFGGWQLAVNNALVAGDLYIPESPFTPMEVDLNRLSLSSEALGLTGLSETQAETEASAPMAPTEAPSEPKKVIDPTQLPLANIQVKSLLLDNKDYGNWSLQLRPDPRGVTIDKIRGSIRGVTVSALNDSAEGAKLIWQNTEVGVQTRFIGRLSATDIGAVMRDWQKPDTLESRSASFEADLFWPGSPQDFSLNNLGGEMSIALQTGRFKRDASAGEGILRLMSVLNFDTLARRLRFDFSDLYKSGLAYDQITGKVRFNQGSLTFEEPLVVTTPSSSMQMAGTIDLRRERINTRLVARLPVAGNVTFYAALAAGLPAAAGIYLVSKLFKKQVDQATSVSYRIKGSWDKPKMSFDRLFESEQSLRDSVNNKKSRTQDNPQSGQ